MKSQTMTNRIELRFIGDPILREKSEPVQKVDDDVREILAEMEKIMRMEAGAGLAAPQIGILRRMLVFMEIKKRGEAGIVHKIINPKIISQSREICAMDEGCLSVQGPGGPVFASVERPESIVAEWTDENGARQKKEFDGYAARALLHEIDHLDGILFIDYLSSAKREMVMRKVKKRK
jgi:peptide deformylase